MKNPIKILSLIAAVSGITIAANAQIYPSNNVVVWHDDFETNAIGANSDDSTYGRMAFNFTGGQQNPVIVITNDLVTGTNIDTGLATTHDAAMMFYVTNGISGDLNCGLATSLIPANGQNILPYIAAYTLDFDVASAGTLGVDGATNTPQVGGFVSTGVGFYGNGAGEYYGPGFGTNWPTGTYGTLGGGYTHLQLNVGGWASSATHGSMINITATNGFQFRLIFFTGAPTNTGLVQIDLCNMILSMDPNYVPPPPTNSIVAVTPGLRIFNQDDTAPWNGEGFSTVDQNQSWVGSATASFPVKYSVNVKEFNTISGFQLAFNFVQNGAPGDVYAIYNDANVMQWRIQSGGGTSGFTSSIIWKTNAPQGGLNSNVVSMVTTSTNGQGNWTLTWTSDTDGSITAPDGSTTNFSIAAAGIASDFADPLIVDIGETPNAAGGYGQYIDLNSIFITNVFGVWESDDFTTATAFNTNNWNTGFSYNDGGVHAIVQITKNTPYFVHWTSPGAGYSLTTKANLADTSIPWYTPWYYSGTTTNGYAISNATTLMGGKAYWTLIPSACLPTTNGVAGGPSSSQVYFRAQTLLSNP